MALPVTKNLKDWPERSIRWTSGSVDCLIQIYLEDPKLLTFNLWLCAFWDSADKRYWKQEFLEKEKRVDVFRDSLFRLLTEGKTRLTEWAESPRTFEVATELKH